MLPKNMDNMKMVMVLVLLRTSKSEDRGVVTTQYGCFAHMISKNQSIQITLQTAAILENVQV